YIGTASWGDCPLTQAQVFEFDAGAGTSLNTFNIVPNGCTGAGLSGSITVDANTDTLYFATGNPGSCATTETLAEAVVKLSAWDGTTLYVAGGGTTIGSVSCNGGLRAVNPATGGYLWQDCLTDGPVLGPTSASPGIVAVAEGNALELMNSSNGLVLFKAADT